MRRLAYVFATISTFIIGVAASMLWFYFSSVTVPLCELARNPDWYDRRVVRVATSASSLFEGVMVADVGCGSGDAAAVLMVDEDYVPKVEVQTFLRGSESQIRKADVVIVGRFDKDATMGCFGPKLGIVARDVELKSVLSHMKRGTKTLLSRCLAGIV
ncbi:MAG: hypothetical protein H0W76_15365 [Pyrinomonadaceae bacterium]|nr:hypothetical protein [Pyrinomonadaceae bacterium]